MERFALGVSPGVTGLSNMVGEGQHLIRQVLHPPSFHLPVGPLKPSQKNLHTA